MYAVRNTAEWCHYDIVVPVSLLWFQDVNYLANQLPNVVDMYMIPWPKFNHIDFLFAINAQSLVFDHVLELLAKYGPS